MKDVALIVFIKNFRLGNVKTRLGKSVGDKRALEIYTRLCTFTIEEVKKTGFATYFYFSDYVDYDFLESQNVDMKSGLYKTSVQEGHDLGIRMDRAFEEVLETHKAGFILGTDCPYFGSSEIAEAVSKLRSEKTNLVIGPAEDGGYYGLGMAQKWDIFSDIDWSTSQVFNQTLDRIKELKATCDTLPVLNDMDYEKDWVAFQESPSFNYFQEVIRSSSSANETVGE